MEGGGVRDGGWRCEGWRVEVDSDVCKGWRVICVRDGGWRCEGWRVEGWEGGFVCGMEGGKHTLYPSTSHVPPLLHNAIECLLF